MSVLNCSLLCGLSCLLGVFVPAYAADTLSFDLTLVKTSVGAEEAAQSAGSSVPIRTEERSRVVLTTDGFVVETSERTTALDLDSEQLTYFNHADRSYLALPIYWLPAFYAYEKQNRIVLAEAARRAGLKMPGARLVDIEMVFGAAPDSETLNALRVASAGESKDLIYEEETLASYTLADLDVPDSLRESNRLYLLYYHPFHQVLRDKLAGSGKLFQSLSYISHEDGRAKTFQFEQVEHGTRDAAAAIPVGYRQRFASDDRLNAVIELSKRTPIKTNADFVKKAEAALRSDDPTGVITTVFAYTMQVDTNDLGPLDDLFKQAVAAMGTSSFLALSRAIANQDSAKAAQGAIRHLETVRDLRPSDGHLLNVYIGNHYAALGDTQKAIDLQLGVLETQPNLTSVYKDLGDHYARLYQMGDAWSAWTRMREINAEHPLVAAVDKLERALLHLYPHFFRQ